MYESLPPSLRAWVEDQARSMGLPSPDDYILLLLTLAKQDQDLERFLNRREFAESSSPALRSAG